MNKIMLISALLISLCMLVFLIGTVFLQDKSSIKTRFPPASYQGVGHITHAQALKYAKEEADLYSQLNYEGTKTFYIRTNAN